MIAKLSFLGIVAVACFAQAIDAQKASKIEDVMRLSKMDTMVAASLDLIAKQMKSGLLQQTLGVQMNDSDKKMFDGFQDRLTAIMSATMSWEKVKPIYTKVYAQEFTDSELDGMIAFYSSDTGRAVINKTPAVMARASQEMQEYMKSAVPQFQAAIAEFMEQSKTQGKAPRAQPKNPKQN